MLTSDARVPVIVTGRSLAEYKEMFKLPGVTAGTSFVDCGAGASSFSAEARQLGAEAIALDPVYDLRFDELRDVVEAGVEATRRNLADSPCDYSFGPQFAFRDVAQHAATRSAAALSFLKDFQQNPSRYLSASITRIPLGTSSMDHVLCSHLLFLHSHEPTLGFEFHMRAISEMARVASVDVRIYPIEGLRGVNRPLLDQVMESLRRDGLRAELQESSYRFFRGANQMMVISSSGDRA
jgi:hypothetical protein